MKSWHANAVMLLAWGLPVAGGAESAVAPQREQVVEAWGWSVAVHEDIAGVRMTAKERDDFRRGVEGALAQQLAPIDARRAFSDLERLVLERRADIIAARRRRNQRAADAYFASLAQNPGLVRLPDGLVIERVTPGRGPMARPGQTVTVRYVGRLLDGTEFCRMDDLEVVLVRNRVMAPLFEGVQRIAAGGKVRLHVPPAVSAGDEEKLGIPVGAGVVYELELLETKPTSETDLANSLLPDAPEPPPAPPSGFSTDELVALWGWSVTGKSGAPGFGLGPADQRAFARGLLNAVGGAERPVSMDVAQKDVDGFVAEQRERRRRAQREARLAAMRTCFAQLDRDPQVVVQSDGLRYQVLQRGVLPAPHRGDVVVVEYVGTLLDGTVFDRTDNEPLHIKVGSVIEGLNEGLQLIGKGGRIRLHVPPALGYGDEDASGVLAKIPAASTLVYDISLLAVEPDSPVRESAAP